MKNPLYDSLFAPHWGNHSTFLYLPDRDLSFDDFLKLASKFANTIASFGLVAGGRLAVQIEKSAEALAVYAACAQSGVVFLPLNTGYTAAEIEYFLGNSGAKLMLCDGKAYESLVDVAQSSGARLAVLNGDGSGDFAEKAKEQSADFQTVERDQDDLAAFLYTSGTTGRSKGAMLSQKNLISNATVLAKAWRFTKADTLLHALPIFHTHGLFVACNISLLTSASMIFQAKFNLEDALAALPKSTVMMGVPTFYTRLLSDARFNQDLVKHMRLFVSGSAPLLAETHIEFENRSGHKILERYGMTETNMNTSNPYVGDRRAGTVGMPLEGVEAKVCDAVTGETLANGEIGVLEVRGDNVFQGYWQMPEKTAEELREDGFFITGDLATQSDDGYITIVGRGKDLIITGGFNVYPKEIETLLDDQPNVLESAVIGVPHPDFGEGVLGIVVPKSGADVEVAQLKAAMSQKLAKFKQPKKIVIMKELPRNTMGKVQKNILRDQFAEALK